MSLAACHPLVFSLAKPHTPTRASNTHLELACVTRQQLQQVAGRPHQRHLAPLAGTQLVKAPLDEREDKRLVGALQEAATAQP